ncbi:LAME_0D03906g1_1 [Lachancea meyersii CBS 8951]|uniref:LAME_0D03906g1_1 n=1 Tax=Lachancea meyersii CBS 8951 TaxID=1266667 RepID=A0A1G4J8C9_9SACH|nr:LAME_0D03906g1_1 [Lachancea meyersii CBS 8951]
MGYVFWPKSLENGSYGSKTVIGVKEPGSDWMVLALLGIEEYGAFCKSKCCQKYGFAKIGTWQKDSGLVLELENAKSTFLVRFKPPRLNLMQFYSLEPIALVLPEKDYLIDSTVGKCHPVVRQTRSSGNAEFRLRTSINLINLYHKHLRLLETSVSRHMEEVRSKKSLTMGFTWYETAIYRKSRALLRCCALYVTICAHFLAVTLIGFLSMTPLKLINISATSQQIDLRCRQLCYFPVQFLRINASAALKDTVNPQTESDMRAPKRSTFPCSNYPDYIRFYNTIWLIANDLSFGFSVGTLLAENQDRIAVFLNTVFTKYLFEKVHLITAALSQNPLGIKLNGELAQFLSDLFLWIIDFSYSTYIRRITSTVSIRIFISIISAASFCFGATFAMAIMVDLISFLTMHISLFYFISAKMYHWQLHVLQTLLYLFYGKKRNVLRNRVDSNLFELDQLLMGTLFFTILVFLLPTFSIFYASFTLLRMAVLVPELLFEFLMALMNHFPLFVLLLRIKDPKRIPGGILLQPVQKGREFKLENNPLTLKAIFRPYSVLLSTMIENHFSLPTLRHILVGHPMTIKRHKMYRILYSTLPEVPAQTREIWASLTSKY